MHHPFDALTLLLTIITCTFVAAICRVIAKRAISALTIKKRERGCTQLVLVWTAKIGRSVSMYRRSQVRRILGDFCLHPFPQPWPRPFQLYSHAPFIYIATSLSFVSFLPPQHCQAPRRVAFVSVLTSNIRQIYFPDFTPHVLAYFLLQPRPFPFVLTRSIGAVVHLTSTS